MTVLKFVIDIKGIKQKDLADMFDIKPQSVQQWINGKKKISNARRNVIENLLGYKCELLEEALTDQNKILILENELALLKSR